MPVPMESWAFNNGQLKEEVETWDFYRESSTMISRHILTVESWKLQHHSRKTLKVRSAMEMLPKGTTIRAPGCSLCLGWEMSPCPIHTDLCVWTNDLVGLLRAWRKLPERLAKTSLVYNQTLYILYPIGWGTRGKNLSNLDRSGVRKEEHSRFLLAMALKTWKYNLQGGFRAKFNYN